MTFYLAGCSSNTSAPPSQQTASIPPLGTTMTQVWNGSGYEVTSTITVNATGLHDPGESTATVLKFVEVDQEGNVDSIFQSYRSDGDVAVNNQDWGVAGTFYTIPFASTAPITSSYNDAGETVNLTEIHNGPGNSYTLNGTPYATDSATVEQSIGGQTTQFHYTLIPSLGIIARMVVEPDPASGQDGQSQWITAYTAK